MHLNGVVSAPCIAGDSQMNWTAAGITTRSLTLVHVDLKGVVQRTNKKKSSHCFLPESSFTPL